MSSKSFDKNYENELHQTKDINNDNLLDNLKKVIIPFSKIVSEERIEYIYLGHEKIPFHARHPTYQEILRNEFVEALKNISKFNFSRSSTKSSISF